MPPTAAPTALDARSPRRAGVPRAVVLVVDDDGAMRDLLRDDLEYEGFQVEVASGGREALECVRAGGIDLVVSDVKMPDLDGLDLLREIRTVEPSPYVITITAFGSIDTAIRAVKLGAFDYITKPFNSEQLLLTIEKALEERALRGEVARLRAEVAGLGSEPGLGGIVGRSAAMEKIFALVRRLDGSNAGVLITGESGTGKELIARALHDNSPRRGAPFVAVNCAAIPETLLESELFGHKRGAFTDARADRAGLFVEANGGTLFLDEIAELPVPLQPKLLRALQEREIRPLGAPRPERVDVRIIAATNKNIENSLKDGGFREDLYYRLNIIHIEVPPLRERNEDVLPIAEHFLARAGARAGKPALELRENVKKLLLAYHWPGNVRELENVIERAVALAQGRFIEVEDLPAPVRERRNPDRLAAALAQGLTLDQLEREYIERVLGAEGGNKTRAAQRLGLDRKTLYRKLDEYAAIDAGGAAPRSDDGEGGS